MGLILRMTIDCALEGYLVNISTFDVTKIVSLKTVLKDAAVAARTVINILILALDTVIVTIGVLTVYSVTYSQDKAYWFIRQWAHVLIYFYNVKLTVTGADNVDFTRSRLYVTNHRSAADIPILISAIGARVSFVAKKELKQVPFLGWSMQAVGMVFIDRGDTAGAIAHLNRAVGDIRSGVNIIIFPEGHRSDDGRTMKPFKKGAFHLALESSVPIQPALVTGTEKIMPKDSLAIRPGHAVVRFGNAILVMPDDTVESLMKKTRMELERLGRMENSD